MTNTIRCEQALQLAGQTTISGEVMAARWHVQHCPDCQRALHNIWTQIAVLDDQLALEQLLGIDLLDAICRQSQRVTTWLAKGTNSVLVAAVRLGTPIGPLSVPNSVARLGGASNDDRVHPKVIRQDEDQTDDGTIKWTVTFVVDSESPERCTAEVQVDMDDRWDLTGVEVFLIWDQFHRRAQTDVQGLVQFSDIPVDVLGQISVILHPPQAPTTMNAPQ